MTLWRQILSFVEILNLNKYMYLYENLQIIIPKYDTSTFTWNQILFWIFFYIKTKYRSILY